MDLKPTLLGAAVVAALSLSAAASAAGPTPSAVTTRANGLLATPAAARLVHRAPGDAFVARDASGDLIRMDRTYRGLRVIGGDIVLHAESGALRSVSQSLRSADRPSLTPAIRADAAAVEAGLRFAGKIEQIARQGLVIYARGAKPVLAYEVELRGQPTALHSGVVLYYVNAMTGKVLDAQDQLQRVAAVGTGKTFYYGNVSLNTDKASATKYTLTDTTRGNATVSDFQGKTASLLNLLFPSGPLYSDSDNVWGNNATSDGVTVATDIAYGVGITFDYYKNVHGRNGIFNDGKGIRSYAHVKFQTSSGGTSGVNAAYYAGNKTMFYGDGDPALNFGPIVAIDVAGHEMTHGLTGATANLSYSGDAGGLNESSSDIFGTLVEFYANNAADPGDYRIGEKMRSGGLAFRDMYNQAADGRSFNCYIGGAGFDPNLASGGIHDPHFTSGVGNRFFYLLAEGAVVPAGSGLTPSQLVCNGDTGIAGIGRDKAGKIWFRTLTTKLTSSSTYPQARAASITAANELYGAGSAESAAVARAWSAASVN